MNPEGVTTTVTQPHNSGLDTVTQTFVQTVWTPGESTPADLFNWYDANGSFSTKIFLVTQATHLEGFFLPRSIHLSPHRKRSPAHQWGTDISSLLLSSTRS